jgi:hypothetical protein
MSPLCGVSYTTGNRFFEAGRSPRLSESKARRLKEERAMRVLYRLCWGVAAVALVSGLFVLQHGRDPEHRWIVYVLSMGGAAVCWLFGRACKYNLAGQ